MEDIISNEEFNKIEGKYNDLQYKIDKVNKKEYDFCECMNRGITYHFYFIDDTQEYKMTITNYSLLYAWRSHQRDFGDLRKITVLDFNFLSKILDKKAINNLKDDCKKGVYYTSWDSDILWFIYKTSDKEYQEKIINIIDKYNYYKDKHVEIKQFNEKEYYKDIYMSI